MAKIYTNSYVRPVYYPAGVNNGQQVYRRAPFDVVVLNGKSLVQPRSLGLNKQAFAQLARDSAEDQANWREGDLGGYETLQPIILGEHQMGDGADNWMGLHKISMV